MSHRRLIALGLNLYLKRFAAEHSAETWKQIVDEPEDWWYAFLGFLDDPDVSFCFNLTSVAVARGVLRAASGVGDASMTDRELLQIKLFPATWPRLEWWENGRRVANPFEAD